MLVIVEDGDIERGLQALLDLKAARSRDVLEVDAAKARGDSLNRFNDLVGVFRVETDREGVDAGELLEQHRLAFHHRHRRARTDVAKAEHRCSVADDGDSVSLNRVLEGALWVLVDCAADASYARRVGHRKVVAGF